MLISHLFPGHNVDPAKCRNKTRDLFMLKTATTSKIEMKTLKKKKRKKKTDILWLILNQ